MAMTTAAIDNNYHALVDKSVEIFQAISIGDKAKFVRLFYLQCTYSQYHESLLFNACYKEDIEMIKLLVMHRDFVPPYGSQEELKCRGNSKRYISKILDKINTLPNNPSFIDKLVLCDKIESVLKARNTPLTIAMRTRVDLL